MNEDPLVYLEQQDDIDAFLATLPTEEELIAYAQATLPDAQAADATLTLDEYIVFLREVYEHYRE